tara:strand:- start:2768 stop:3283 length:516 start_codon:yes stop_codon:yes gene_type:complete
MKVINLFGGPGCGKSTAAAGLFHLMKSRRMSVELVNEFAKDVVWDNSRDILKDQLYIFANQNRKLERLKGRVDYAITDSPLLLTLIYMPKNYPESFISFVHDIFDSYDNTNVFINRVKPYIESGRVETEEQAKEIDDKIKPLLWNSKSVLTNGDDNAPYEIYSRLFEVNRR